MLVRHNGKEREKVISFSFGRVLVILGVYFKVEGRML